jgi:hypothetical protein
MDFQTVINVGAGLVLGVVGWFARELWAAVQDLRIDLGKLREELPKTYITKDDFKDEAREIKDMLITINAKLDRKADKS